tara:strand:- start:254 stop:574 length:321 start_codon:yes stop_codon:yes gene_type:complete
MNKNSLTHKLKLFLRMYSIFSTLTLTVTAVTLIREFSEQDFSILTYLKTMSVIIFVFAISALPFDFGRKKKDERLCRSIGIKYEEFVFMTESERLKLREQAETKFK